VLSVAADRIPSWFFSSRRSRRILTPSWTTPVLAHAFFPQISQSLIPVIIKELGNLLKMRVTQSLDILSQLLQSKLGMRFTVRIVKDIHQLPDNMRKLCTKPSSALSSAVIACFSSPDKLLGFLRRLQRQVHNFLAKAMLASCCWASPLALTFLR